jgi:hypothetical protein
VAQQVLERVLVRLWVWPALTLPQTLALRELGQMLLTPVQSGSLLLVWMRAPIRAPTRVLLASMPAPLLALPQRV